MDDTDSIWHAITQRSAAGYHSLTVANLSDADILHLVKECFRVTRNQIGAYTIAWD